MGAAPGRNQTGASGPGLDSDVDRCRRVQDRDKLEAVVRWA